MLAINNGF
ncbi:hypothetical protein D030_4511A, partial [Vibrio parahaemolyticus AQ3810]